MNSNNPLTSKPSSPTLNDRIENPLDRLATVLNQQIQGYDHAEELMQEKRQILVSGNPYQLAHLDQKLTSIAQELTKLEDQRQDILKHLGFENQPLSKMIEQLSAQDAKPLRPLREKLKRSVQKVHDTNQQTKSLIELSLNWVADTVELIAKSVIPETGQYNAGGQIQESAQAQLTEGLGSTIEREA